MLASARKPSSRANSDRIAALLRDLDRHQLRVELAFVPCRRGALVAADRECVGLLARDGIVAGEILGGLDHAADHTEALDRLTHHPAAREPVPQRDIAHPRAVAGLGGVVLDVGHALDSAREHAVGDAGLDHHRRGRDGLKPCTAAPVELKAGHFDRHSGGEPAPAPDRGCLAAAIALAEHHIVDARGIDPAALDQRLDDERPELPRFERS